MNYQHLPPRQGLYDSRFEKDSCGVGFVCDIKGRKTNQTVRDGLVVLERLSHRGAVGADPDTGDGAGILIQTPHGFFRKLADRAGFELPAYGKYGSGMVFFPQIETERRFCRKVFERIVREEGQKLLGWRDVPVDNSVIGREARDSEPKIEQVFIGMAEDISDPLYFERRLYVIRKRAENELRGAGLSQNSFFYITNLSFRTFSYKGLLMPDQVERFFVDLKDPDIQSAICLVHSRYSTNTFPTWDLAQPFRFLAHNGEINTLQGNINWMRAREGQLQSPVFGRDIGNIKPVIVPKGSDSAAIDNVFELLMLSGRSLPHTVAMLIPAAWENHPLMDKKLKDFYRYHACFMEPWDGPAAIAVTDGSRISAVLDRNGLRPARYIITSDERVVMASEVGVLDFDPKDIRVSGRLEPGKMFYVDTEEGRIIHDEEVKERLAEEHPYATWVRKFLLPLSQLPEKPPAPAERSELDFRLRAFGFTREDLKVILKPMAESAQEPTYSMGNDTAHAVLANRPHLLYDYFKQLFAQVTNPAIDPIREEIVMSLTGFIGPEKDLLEPSPPHCRKLKVDSPVLTNEELSRIKGIEENDFQSRVISLLFSLEDSEGFADALDRICREAVEAINQGYTFIILSDRGVDREKAALPALLALGAVHHHLIRNALRTQIGIIVESAEPREVHHFAVLFGYGADCVNPYLVFELLETMASEKTIEFDAITAKSNYIQAVNKGLLKIISKMGISTIRSYRGAQIFEALGVHPEVIERCFSGTVSRIGGADLDVIREETLIRHSQARKETVAKNPVLPGGGTYQWRKDGDFHLWNPETISLLQDATRRNDFKKYREFAARINDQAPNPVTLRSLLKFKSVEPVPLEQVEPKEEIFKRFVTGAMSFGSISKEAHETLAIAMNRLGGRSNTGEGGEDPARFIPLPNGDSRRSAIKQIASGRFGVTTNYLINADEIQIKIAQGAKPGEGGQLPGHKVNVTIASTRYATPGVTLISPPPHHDIYSIEDLAQLIFDLKNTNPRARISVKLVSEAGVGTIAAGVAKGHADMILISGADGGTGASPLSSIRHAGLPWELGLSETHQTLVLNDLRARVRLQTDGQMRTGRDVAIAALLGAEEFGFSTAALIVIGCVMLRHCHLNNCSMGVATQDELLRQRFRGRAEYVENYIRFIARELREIMAGLGIRRINEMVGRTDLLETDEAMLPWKAKKMDFSGILYKPVVSAGVKVHFQQPQDHGIDKVLDRRLIEIAAPALEKGDPVREEMAIRNSDRTVGAMLSGEIVKNFGENGLNEDTVSFKFKGVAGQSFGAWLARGVTFELEGMANDYTGKGLSGGKIIIYPQRETSYAADENIIIGNTTFYGAITGAAYISGVAGERFCIRNSGIYAVVEGVGDHGCEYMTGGRVVILGETGVNFAAGMSGGIAYVYDKNKLFHERCNLSMVELESLGPDDETLAREMIHDHFKYTGSPKARMILNDFSRFIKDFVKVMPLEYKRILEQKKLEDELNVSQTM